MRIYLLILLLLSCSTDRKPSSIFKTNCIQSFLELTAFYRDEEVLNVLRSARVRTYEPIMGTNKTEVYQVEFWNNEHLKGLYKPRIDHFASHPELEALAYKFDRFLDLQLVPPTIVRKLSHGGDLREGSLQLFMENAVDFYTFKESLGVLGAVEDMQMINHTMIDRQHFLDYLLYNRDRHWGNFLVKVNGDIISIDHGGSFGRAGLAPLKFGERVRALGRFFETEKGHRVVERLRSWDQQKLYQYLQKDLSPEELTDLFQRIDLLIKHHDARVLLSFSDWSMLGLSDFVKKLTKEKDLGGMLMLADGVLIDYDLVKTYAILIDRKTPFIKKVRAALLEKGGIYTEMLRTRQF